MEEKELVENNDDTKTMKTDNLIKNHILGAMGISLIPVPIVDFLALSGLQLSMISKLATEYDVEFSKEQAKSIVSSLIGGLTPLLIAGPVASLAKFIPVIGTAAGGATLAITSGASTYALGKVFILHFESGGTLLNFDVKAMKSKFAEKFQEGKNVAGDLKEESAG